MPRDIIQVVKGGVDREQFVHAQAGKVRPPAGNRPEWARMFSQRNKRLAIRKAAKQRREITIIYHKITDGETNHYSRLSPYSYRYRWTRKGWRKMLFAFDPEDGHIKGFVIRNIERVLILDSRYSPRYRVEIM